ncbi:MAG: DoxX family protein [Planctomycetes bacterium]|nr:DoxX family protein [Planctomycetota bacterium]
MTELTLSLLPDFTLTTVLQVILALGLFNVWLLRTGKATNYRGGQAKNLKEEFATYGLPPFMYFLVGGLKILCAIALLVGLWVPAAVVPAAGVLAILMLGALAMHIKVGDPISKSVPAFCMLAMSTALGLLAL